MVVIQTTVCVSVCVCVVGVLPFTPSYYAYYTDLLGCFCSGNRLLLFFTCSLQPSLFSPFILLILLSLFLSSIHLPPLYPHSSPEAMGEGEREGEAERQDRPALLKTLFTPGM